MADQTKRVEVCKCENCGNEAEMVVTCELLPPSPGEAAAATGKREKKTFTCVNCGNEADLIIDG
jgi:hypothetical protein